MLSKDIQKIIYLILWGLLGVPADGKADVLLPPTKVPFAADVTIKKYTQWYPLTLFRYTGQWDVVQTGNKVSLVGTSKETPTYIISIDKISKNPKSFKFDFTISDVTKDYGFIYGNIGVIVRNNMMYPAVFDVKNNTVKQSSKVGRPIARGIQNINTVDINTGYDQTGGKGQICVIYINNTGLTFEYHSKDQPFGVYLWPGNSITINNIRWGIGAI